MTDTIRIGPLELSYERPGITVSLMHGDDGETIGYCEIVSPGEWDEIERAHSALPDLRRCTCRVSHADDCDLRANEGLGWFRAGGSLREARGLMEMIGGLPVYVRGAHGTADVLAERAFNIGPRASERVTTIEDFDAAVRAALENSPTGEVGLARVSL